MPFKMVTVSEREVARIAGNAGAFAELMARTLTERWRQDLPPDQEVIDVQQLQLCVRDDLHRLRAEIRDIEKQHLERLEDARLSREVRDVGIPQLRGPLLGIQRLFDGTFGAGSSSLVFGEDTVSIPTDPLPLVRLGRIAHDRLIAPGFSMPASQLAGVDIAPAALAASFEPALASLEGALDGLEALVPATNETLARKIETLDDLRTQAGIAARFLEALYALAGHLEIARRVRLSSHRSRDAADAGEGDVTVDQGGVPDGGVPDGEPPSSEQSVEAAPAAVAAQDARRAA